MYTRRMTAFVEEMVNADSFVLNAALNGVATTRLFASGLTGSLDILTIRERFASMVREISERRDHRDTKMFTKMKMAWFDRRFERELRKARDAAKAEGCGAAGTETPSHRETNKVAASVRRPSRIPSTGNEIVFAHSMVHSKVC